MMNVAVWDTYVTREDNKVMHFDILVPSDLSDEESIFNFGMNYLKTKPFQTNQLTTKECRLCHITTATEDVINNIKTQGYSIIEMENCY